MCNNPMKLIVSSALVHVAAAGALVADLEIDWWTVDGGGVLVATGGVLELSGTIGQPDAGVVMTGGTLELTGGFWAAAAIGPVLPGDCNGDGHVDLDDYRIFAPCLWGPGGGLGTDCECFDLDFSGDVDLFDFAMFQETYTG